MSVIALALSVLSAKCGLHGARPLHKERDGRDLRDLRNRRHAIGGREWQRQQRELVLAAHMERLATGGEDGQARTGRQERDDGRRGIKHPLAIVQHQQEPLGCQERGERVDEVPLGTLPHAERGGNGGHHQVRIGQRREIDEDHPVGKDVMHVLRPPRWPAASCRHRRVR